MRSSQGASAALAAVVMALVVSGCGAKSPTTTIPGATCSGTGRSVEVVVELGDRHVVDRCVAFSGATIAGGTAMKRSRIEFASQHFSFGDAICQIDRDPTSYTDCLGSGQPYWALFIWSGGRWKAASTGISQVTLSSGEALGWRYDGSQGTAPPPPRPPKR